MITLVHQHQIKISYPKFTRQEHRIIIDEALNVAKKKRDIMCRGNGKPREGIGKAPAFYLVTLHILNLVPETHKRHKFYVSLFLFMFNTGQRFISMSNIMITDIKNDIFFENIRIIVNIVCRITKANQDWNQYFNIEGDLTEKSIMNFVYWLNEFLKEEHELDIMNFKIWDKNIVEEKFLWGDDTSNFKNPVRYQIIYKTWRKFYTKAGIPDKLLGVHSFRSAFSCQSILNSEKKNLDIDTMMELSQLLAGWKNKTDAAIYFKSQMNGLVTYAGFLEDPTAEQLLEYDRKFKSTWSSPAQILGVIGEFQPTWDEE
jgi:hypothetical protein